MYIKKKIYIQYVINVYLVYAIIVHLVFVIIHTLSIHIQSIYNA
jgi:hypothetical protein